MCPASGGVLGWVTGRSSSLASLWMGLYHQPSLVWPQQTSRNRIISWVCYPAGGLTVWQVQRHRAGMFVSDLASKPPNIQTMQQRQRSHGWSKHRHVLKYCLGCSSLRCPHSGEWTEESSYPAVRTVYDCIRFLSGSFSIQESSDPA